MLLYTLSSCLGLTHPSILLSFNHQFHIEELTPPWKYRPLAQTMSLRAQVVHRGQNEFDQASPYSSEIFLGLLPQLPMVFKIGRLSAW